MLLFFFKGWSNNFKCGVKPEVSLLYVFFGQKKYTLPKTYMEPEKMLAFEKEYLSSRWPLSGSMLVFRTRCVLCHWLLWYILSGFGGCFFRRVPTKIRWSLGSTVEARDQPLKTPGIKAHTKSCASSVGWPQLGERERNEIAILRQSGEKLGFFPGKPLNHHLWIAREKKTQFFGIHTFFADIYFIFFSCESYC